MSTSEAKAYSQSCYKHGVMRGKLSEAHGREPPLTTCPREGVARIALRFALLPHKSRMLWVYKDFVAYLLL